MEVVIIMTCALVGTIALLFLAGTARWSFTYLIRYRWLKHEVNSSQYEMSANRDAIAAVVAVISLVVVSILLIYGVPFVVEHYPELPLLT